MRYGSTTRDSNESKVSRVMRALRKEQNWADSNRDLAGRLAVDEGMVRKYRDLLGVPKLQVGTGKPLPVKKRRKAKR